MGMGGFSADEGAQLTSILGSLQRHWMAVETCLKIDLTIPAMTLVFVQIDSLAWLTVPKSRRGNKARFLAWVETWLEPESQPNYSSVELYSARNALVHSMSSESNLFENRTERRAMYYRHFVSPAVIQDTLQGRQNELFAINCDEFFSEVKCASVRCLGSADTDDGMRRRLLSRAHSYYFAPLIDPVRSDDPSG